MLTDLVLELPMISKVITGVMIESGGQTFEGRAGYKLSLLVQVEGFMTPCDPIIGTCLIVTYTFG